MTFDEPYETTSKIPQASLPKEYARTLEPNINVQKITGTQFNVLLAQIQRLDNKINSLTDQVVTLNSEVYDLQTRSGDDLRIGY